jgi:hypothetical protein
MKPEKFSFDFEAKQGAEQSAPPQPKSALLESTKLSHRPKLKHRAFELPAVAMALVPVCVNCGRTLEADDNILQSIKVCRKCLTQYVVIDEAIDEASKRKQQSILRKSIRRSK